MSQNQINQLCEAAHKALDNYKRIDADGNRVKGFGLYTPSDVLNKLKEGLLSAINSEPNNPELHYLLGTLRYENITDDDLAIEEFLKAVNLNKDDVRFMKALGLIYYDYYASNHQSQPKIKEAIPWLEKVVEKTPDDEVCWKALIHCFDRLETSVKKSYGVVLPERTKYIPKLLSQFPDHPWVIEKVADYYYDSIDFKTAIEYYKKAYNSKTSTEKILERLSHCYGRIEDFLNAIECQEKILELKNKIDIFYDDIPYDLKDYYLKQYPNLEIQGHKIRENWLKSAANSVKDKLSWGIEYFNKANFQYALDYLMTYSKFYPDNTDVLGNIAVIYFTTNDNQKGLLITDTLKKQNASEYYPLIAIAHSYALQKDFTKAEEYYQKAIKSQSNNGLAQAWLASMYMLMKNKEKAVEICDNLLSKEIPSLAIYFKMADVMYSMEDIMRSIELYAYVLESDHKNVSLYDPLIKIYSKLENFEYVIEYIKIALKFSPKNPIMLETFKQVCAKFNKSLDISTILNNP